MIKCFNKYIFKENFIKEFIKEGGMKSMTIQHYCEWFGFSKMDIGSLSILERLKR